MSIAGVNIERSGACMLVHITRFSKELQQLIRDQLAGIYHGFAEVETLSSDFYSYSNTVASFLERFDTKSEDIQKGMIGELLAHVLINALMNNITSLSIYKNKEERSIKKGFDIIYYHNRKKNLWYTEVKSGRSSSAKVTSDSYNTKLLKRSRDSIIEMFDSKRNDLWQSAMLDVLAVIEPGSKQLKMKELLAKDAPIKKGIVPKRNVILVSVLYHPMADMITADEVKAFHKDTKDKNIFENAAVFCIQKETFQKVAAFLKAESKKP